MKMLEAAAIDHTVKPKANDNANLLSAMKSRISKGLSDSFTSSAAPKPSHTIRNINSNREDNVTMSSELVDAFEDENTTSIAAAYAFVKQSAITAKKASEVTAIDVSNKVDSKAEGKSQVEWKFGKKNASESTSEDKSLPLFKRLKAGDRVMAKYSLDGKYYEASIKKVVHKGYPSAQYDVQYTNYDTIEAVSWRDVFELEDEERYEESPSAMEESKPGIAAGNVDAFGRDLSMISSKKAEESLRSVDRSLMDDSVSLSTGKHCQTASIPNKIESLIYKRFSQGPKYLSPLDGLKDEDFVNHETYDALKGSWKRVKI